jgi:ADP-ribose pyrophosphatase YjhB (NUDIX family)
VILAYCSACGAKLGLAPPCRCAVCGREFWDNAKPCGGAFVAHGGRLLLVLRAHDPWSGRWDVPGGFCDGAEHPEAATVREAREETGLVIHLTGLLGLWIDRYDADDPDSATTLNVYYHAVADDPHRASAPRRDHRSPLVLGPPAARRAPRLPPPHAGRRHRVALVAGRDRALTLSSEHPTPCR